MMGH